MHMIRPKWGFRVTLILIPDFANTTLSVLLTHFWILGFSLQIVEIHIAVLKVSLADSRKPERTAHCIHVYEGRQVGVWTSKVAQVWSRCIIGGEVGGSVRSLMTRCLE